MRLRPLSLFTRMLLVMFGSIATAQLISGVLIYNDREAQSSRIAVFEWSRRVADTLRMLEAVTPEQRRVVLERLASPATGQNAKRNRLMPIDRHFDGEFAANFKERLNFLLDSHYSIEVTEPGTSRPDVVLASSTGGEPAEPAHVFDVHVRLPEGDSLLARLFVTPRM